VAAGVFEHVDARVFGELRGLFAGFHGKVNTKFKPKREILLVRLAAMEDEIIHAYGRENLQIMKSALIAGSAAIILVLGLVHLLYTFHGTMLHPRDPDLTAKMMAVSPVISRETTMWRAWVGFNASHSFCLIFFGALYGYLAMRHGAFLFQSWFLLAFGLLLLLGYAVLSRLYWFNAPFRGVVLAAVLYLLGIVVNLMQSAAR